MRRFSTSRGAVIASRSSTLKKICEHARFRRRLCMPWNRDAPEMALYRCTRHWRENTRWTSYRADTRECRSDMPKTRRTCRAIGSDIPCKRHRVQSGCPLATILKSLLSSLVVLTNSSGKSRKSMLYRRNDKFLSWIDRLPKRTRWRSKGT